jgi:ERCC4-related helicase
MKSSNFQTAMRYIAREDEEDDAIPTSMAEEMDESGEAKRSLEGMPAIDHSTYDLRRLHDAVQRDVDVLSEIWHRLKDISEENDAKLARLKKLLSTELRGKKILVFTYYKDTARYLYR